MGRVIRCGLLALAPLLLVPAARAHGIESQLSPLHGLGDQLLLHSQFSNGEPTRDAVVRLVPPQGQPLELGRTDQHGQLSFALPKGATGSWELQVDGGPGHRDYLEMPLRRGQAQLDQVSEQPQPAHGGLRVAAETAGGQHRPHLAFKEIRRVGRYALSENARAKCCRQDEWTSNNPMHTVPLCAPKKGNTSRRWSAINVCKGGTGTLKCRHRSLSSPRG